jgi:choline dehydrogenase-like flavoprotein
LSRHIDARSSETTQPIEADICIVGAGAAGVTLAANLEKSGLKVVLLEAGGLQMEGQTQSLYDAQQTGLRYYDMTSCRLRYYGGTTNHWSGYCRENDRIDYEGRPGLDVPKWPVGYDEIAPFVSQAARLLGLEPREFDPAIKAEKHGFEAAQLLERQSPAFTTKVFQISRRRRIHELYDGVLDRQENLDVFLNANVTHIQLAPGGQRVAHVEARAFGKPPFKVVAKSFVLAAHAVETARLLLASTDVMPQGIGNRHGHVGRYFMEHPYVISGLMFPTERFPHLYDYEWTKRRSLNVNLSFSEQTMRQEGMLQYYCRFDPIYGHEHINEAASRLKSDFWSPGNMTALKALGTVFGDVPNTARFVGAKLTDRPAAPVAYRLDHRIEQSPNPNSRITLSNEVDALGVRKVVLNWDLNDLDYRTFARGQEVLVREFSRLKIASFDAPALTPELIRKHVKGHYHHIGTTRMSDDETTGVVDRHCRVHGVNNLYIAGSGIFPSSGYSGPTMMIIAFAMRLAAHLKEAGKVA